MNEITITNYAEEIDRLNKLLSEKDKEIEAKAKALKFLITNCCNDCKQKTEFAIDKLEKLLEKTQTLDVMVQSGHYINQNKVNVVFKEIIDQQIKELKEKNNG